MNAVFIHFFFSHLFSRSILCVWLVFWYAAKLDRNLVDGKVAFLMNDSVLCIKLSSDICDASDGSHIRTVPLSHDHFYTLVKVFPGLRGSDSCFYTVTDAGRGSSVPHYSSQKTCRAQRQCSRWLLSWRSSRYGSSFVVVVVTIQVEPHNDMTACWSKTLYLFMSSKVLLSNLDWCKHTHTQR